MVNGVPGSTQYRPNFKASLPSEHFKYSIAPDCYAVVIREPYSPPKQCIDEELGECTLDRRVQLTL